MPFTVRTVKSGKKIQVSGHSRSRHFGGQGKTFMWHTHSPPALGSAEHNSDQSSPAPALRTPDSMTLIHSATFIYWHPLACHPFGYSNNKFRRGEQVLDAKSQQGGERGLHPARARNPTVCKILCPSPNICCHPSEQRGLNPFTKLHYLQATFKLKIAL